MKEKIAKFTVFVKDLEKIVKFYQNIVGFNVKWKRDEPFAELEYENKIFSIFEYNNLPSIKDNLFETRLLDNEKIYFTVSVGNPQNVDKTFKNMTKNGAIPISHPRNEPWQIRAAKVTDPEGNFIEVTSDFLK